MTSRAVRLLGPAFMLAASAAMIGARFVPDWNLFPDRAGTVATVSRSGKIDTSGAFFQSLGTNGRTCATCHQMDQAMSLSAAGVRKIYRRSGGTDPLFAMVDGANCPTDDASRRESHSLLLDRGLFRIALPLPASREFSVSVVHDPYGCAITYDADTGAEIISVYRRPLPATNLRFLSAVMFDGRETALPLTSASTFAANLEADLKQQAVDAILGHAQAANPPSDAQLKEIVDFELGLHTAQIVDRGAGMLQNYGASGGPAALSHQQYYPGINDTLGGDPAGIVFNPSAMSLFSAWDPANGWGSHEDEDGARMRARIAAGEKLFKLLWQ
jgi:cytochrome c peroxidase